MYAIYRAKDFPSMPLARVRKIGTLFGIEGAETMTKSALKWPILNHPRNLSPVPHPLIRVEA